jgi:lipopolysaccharide export LptBFGC system permease protein LptF
MTTKFTSAKKGSSTKEIVFSLAIALVYFFTFFFLISFNGLAQSSSSKEEIVLSKYASKDGIQDARPLVSADGKNLYFGRRNNGKNVGGKTDLQDIWFASLDTLNKFSKVHTPGEKYKYG